MGRNKSNKMQPIVTDATQPELINEEQPIVTDAILLDGLQTIVGTGKSQFIKQGSERVVSAEMAMCLIAKGSAKLK